MDRNELLKCLKENTAHCFEPVSPDQRARLEETIGDSLPSDAWLILSLKDKSVELEQHGSHIIIMSPDEVMSSPEDLQVDFWGKRLVPLADCFDNDYLIFDLDKQHYCLFNIVDEIDFDIYASIYDFLINKT